MNENEINCYKSMLIERNKELKCLYTMAKIIEQYDIGLDQVLRKIVNIIPAAMQFPDKTHAKLKIQNIIYTSKSFEEFNIISKNIIYKGNVPVGTLSIYLDSKEIPQFNKFILPEEISLINYLCERIGRVIQRISFSEELEITRSKLEIQNTLLERKNITLFEVLDHLNSDKDKKEEEIMTTIDTIVLPLIDSMRNKPNPEQYLDILSATIKDITSSFATKLKNNFSNLSLREIEICNLLKNEKSSKEIGILLSLSPKTINKHRDNIRRKLGIKNKKVNLISFLKT